MLFQSPRASEQPREDVSITDDASSTGNKDEDDDEDEEDVNDENFDGLNRDPERLKAFNVSRLKLWFWHKYSKSCVCWLDCLNGA